MMALRYQLEGLGFKMRMKKKIWKTNSNMELVRLSTGSVRVLDTRSNKPAILMIPDGPNVIEHHMDNITQLSQNYRVIAFDLYGFGFSVHDGSYDYSFDKTTQVIRELLDVLQIHRTSIIFPCAIGLYGVAFAEAYPEMVNHLMLLQTPSSHQMNLWAKRIVPPILKKPVLSQMIMPFMERKFAHKWYDYALPKGVDRQPYQTIAVDAIDHGGVFCLCSLTQGLHAVRDQQFSVSEDIPMTLIHGDTDFTHRDSNFESIRDYQQQVDIIAFEGCGHFPDLEQPKRFLQLVQEKLV